MHVHDLVPFPDKNFDLSHTITKLTFGKGYPGQQNPLDGVFINQTTSTASQAATGMWQYFLKVYLLPQDQHVPYDASGFFRLHFVCVIVSLIANVLMVHKLSHC